MNNILIIGFSDMCKLNKGYAFWQGEYYSQIKEFTDVSALNLQNTPLGIGYLTGKANDGLTCISLLIHEIKNEKNTLSIKYSADDELRYKSSSVKIALREALREKHGTVMNLPFCAAVDSDFINGILDDEVLFREIKRLKAKNEWKKIYSLFEPVDQIESKKHIWNNAFMLDNLSFASAKLSETCINLKQFYPDEKKRKDFLATQKRYRELAISIRKRLILLRPDNPGYYSNLGYSYYQSCRELMHPGGRRDGNVINDANLALENINKALELEPNRISDLYRKGQILTVILPPNLLFGKNLLPDSEKIKDVRNKIYDGIKAFKSAVDVFELIPLVDEKSLTRYFKEYIKSLYDISRSYCDLSRAKFEYISFLSGNGTKNDVVYNSAEDIANINLALDYIGLCIEKDSGVKRIEKNDIISKGSCNGVIDSVFKLYMAGKCNFCKYLILKKSRRPEEAREFLIKSERLFLASLSSKFKPEKSMQNKNFIKEKLARVYIEQGEFKKASELLERIVEKRADYYIRYTYALSEYLRGNIENAAKQLKLALENQKSNKDQKTGEKFLEMITVKK